MTIKPLADKVVVKKLQAEETTKSGIILSSGAQQKPQIAEIIAVGPGGIVDGNEIKKALRYWDEDSVYTIRQQKLLLKLIARKKQMNEKPEQDTPVFINETKMKIERNRRLGRAKAKRTKIQELTENVEQLTKLVTMLVANQGIPQEAPVVSEPTGSFRDFTKEEKKKLMVAMPKVEIKQVDNSDIDEKSGYDSEALKEFYERACSLLEQNRLSWGHAKMFCEKVCLQNLTDRRRYKDTSPANSFEPAQRLMLFQSYNSLLSDFIKAKQTGKICTMHYADDPDSMGKAKRTAEQKLESAFNWCVKEQKTAQEMIYWEARV